MIFRCQCVFLKNISGGEIQDVGWDGGVGKYDTTEKLGRGGVEFLYLANLVDRYPSLLYVFGIYEIGSGVDEVIEGGEEILVF